MNGHWSDRESIDLLRISINNYPKFLHLKNTGQPDKFFDERCFSKFHNLGRNGKSIKTKIDNIQKKFRKNIRNIDINKFRDGVIDEDCYKNDEMKELFNTSFEFERLFGKFCGSKELMKIIDLVCHSDYWTRNRHRIHPRWSKRSVSSADDEDKLARPTVIQSAIVISSAESSPRDSETFKDTDFVVHRRPRYDSAQGLTVNISKKRVNRDSNEEHYPYTKRSLISRPATDIDGNCCSPTLLMKTSTVATNGYPPSVNGEAMLTIVDSPNENGETVLNISDSSNAETKNVVTISDSSIEIGETSLNIGSSSNTNKETLSINGYSHCTQKNVVINSDSTSVNTPIFGASDKETNTAKVVEHLSMSDEMVTDIEPSMDYEEISGDRYLFKMISESMVPIVDEVAALNVTMRNIAESLQQLVKLMSNNKPI